jgi:NADH:ubiquinone oxidoreductase subunit E
MSDELATVLGTALAATATAGRGALIPLLQRVQEKLGYVSEEAIFGISDRLGLSAAEVFGVLTFYAQFRLTPTGKHNVKVCRGTACHVQGAQEIIAGVEDELGLRAGRDTTDDLLFTVEKIACFGACSLAPVMVVDGETHGRMMPNQARRLVQQVKERDHA